MMMVGNEMAHTAALVRARDHLKLQNATVDQ